MAAPGPPVLLPHDGRWPARAGELIAALERVVPTSWSIDHIGSTSVPGLPAKNVLDLQARVPELLPQQELDGLLAPTGFVPTTGARPDSPGVHHDSQRGSEDVPEEVWTKRLYLLGEGPTAVLHVRRLDSPWGRYTLWFRDWLREHDDERDAYAAVKQRLAEEHAKDADFDDYTRAKTAYFNEVQPRFERWARERSLRQA